jgi:hypothetical protein
MEYTQIYDIKHKHVNRGDEAKIKQVFGLITILQRALMKS